jgi:hypothetical protein
VHVRPEQEADPLADQRPAHEHDGGHDQSIGRVGSTQLVDDAGQDPDREQQARGQADPRGGPCQQT